jgi:hypothetical protein
LVSGTFAPQNGPVAQLVVVVKEALRRLCGRGPVFSPPRSRYGQRSLTATQADFLGGKSPGRRYYSDSGRYKMWSFTYRQAGWFKSAEQADGSFD